MSRVFVVQEPMKWDSRRRKVVPQFDIRPAQKFGNLVVLVPYGVKAQSTEEVLDLLKKGLQDFKDEDFLLPTGNPIIIGLASTIAADYNGGHVTFLRWSKAESMHIPVTYTDIFEEDD